jgi:hypothetical protein
MKTEVIKLGARRGIRRYLRPGARSWSNVQQGELTIGGRAFKLVQFRGGAPELYRIGLDGLEEFVGYAVEALPDLVRARRKAG